MAKPVEPPQDRQVFIQRFTPGAGDIDPNGHVNNVVYLAWVQEIAVAHWRSVQPAETLTRWSWIVVRHEIDYRRPLMLGETALARTWVAGEADGPLFRRYVRIDRPDGMMCAQARTLWCQLDKATRRPVRANRAMLDRFS